MEGIVTPVKVVGHQFYGQDGLQVPAFAEGFVVRSLCGEIIAVPGCRNNLIPDLRLRRFRQIIFEIEGFPAREIILEAEAHAPAPLAGEPLCHLHGHPAVETAAEGSLAAEDLIQPPGLFIQDRICLESRRLGLGGRQGVVQVEFRSEKPGTALGGLPLDLGVRSNFVCPGTFLCTGNGELVVAIGIHVL